MVDSSQAVLGELQVCNDSVCLHDLFGSLRPAEQECLLDGLQNAMAEFVDEKRLMHHDRQNTLGNQPEIQDSKDNEVVDELKRELLNTNVKLVRTTAQLTADRTQLELASEQRVFQENRLHQREQEISDMQSELALVRQNNQHALIEQSTCERDEAIYDLSATNFKMQLHVERLQQREDELKKCEKHMVKLDATTKDLLHKMFRMKRQRRLLAAQQSASILQQLQQAHIQIVENCNAAQELRAHLTVNFPNMEPQDHQAASAKGSLHIQESAGQKNDNGALRKSPSVQALQHSISLRNQLLAQLAVLQQVQV